MSACVFELDYAAGLSLKMQDIVQSELPTPDLIEAVAMNALTSLHVFLKTALMHVHAAVKGFLTPAVHSAH